MSFYRKYRPQKFAAVIGEDHVRDTLLSAIKENKVGHGYLFAGPRGIGKTTVARLLAKAVNCRRRDELNKKKSGEPCDQCEFCRGIVAGKNLDIIEIDAASNRGIDEIRELREKVKFSPTSGKYKVFIIDEVHMLTLPAFNALLKTLEEPPPHAIFILATTEAHKIPATILSRVQRFDFHRIGKDDIIKNLKLIAKSEKLETDDDALEAIAVAAEGSHRDSISLLEQVATLSKKITLGDVRSILGLAKSEEIIGIVERIASADSKVAIKIVDGLISEGVDGSQMLKGIIETFRQLLLISISGGVIDFEITKERMTKLKSLAEGFSAGKINQILEIFINSSQLAKETSIRSLPIEMAIVEAVGITEEPKNLRTEEQKENPRPKADQPMAENIKEEKPKPVVVVNQPMNNLDQQIWKTILEKIKSQNHSLNALLRDASPEGIDGDELIIAVRFKFHHDKISEIQNCQAIEKVVEEVLGKKLKVKCRMKESKKSEIPVSPAGGRNPTRLADGSPRRESETGKTDNLEKAAAEIFEVE